MLHSFMESSGYISWGTRNSVSHDNDAFKATHQLQMLVQRKHNMKIGNYAGTYKKTFDPHASLICFLDISVELFELNTGIGLRSNSQGVAQSHASDAASTLYALYPPHSHLHVCKIVQLRKRHDVLPRIFQ